MRSRLAALVLLLALPAPAYNEAVHALITKSALARTPGGDEVLAPPTEEDLAALRTLFWQTAATLPDEALRARFLARFPSADALDAWSFKEFLMLDPAARVHGFDPTPEGAQPRLALLTDASRWPDDDKRNQNRFARDGARQIVLAPDGTPVPDDPATLDLGGLRGGTSQGHAHYGLLPGPLSDDPEVLKKDPARFAVPSTAHAFGADFAQLYTDLALLLAASDLPARGWLSAAFAGAAFHHLEDVANQIHTVQVGIYDFFESAFLQSKLRDLKTLGGLLGERRTLKQMGLRLIANHHLLSEDLFAKRMLERSPAVQAATEALTQTDASFEPQLRPDYFGKDLAEAMVQASSKEAPQIYRLAFAYSAPTLRDGLGHEYDGAKGDDPDAYLARGPRSAAAQAEFYALQANGVRRAVTALRLWEAAFAGSLAGDRLAVRRASVQRMLAMLLPYHEQQEVRRAAYLPERPEHQGIAWGYPIAALVLLIALALLARALLRRRGLRWKPG